MSDNFQFGNSLAKALEQISEGTEPKLLMSKLLTSAKDVTNSTCCCLYSLDPAESMYTPTLLCHCPNKAKRECIPIVDNKIDNKKHPFISEVIKTHVPNVLNNLSLNHSTFCHDEKILSRIIIPILREKECIGVLDFGSTETESYTKEHEIYFQSIAAIYSLLLEKENTLNFLKVVQEPVNFHQSEEKFLEELVLLISGATNLKYIAIRELIDDEHLECIAQYGFENKAALTFENIDEFLPFKNAIINKKSYVFPTMKHSDLKALKRMDNLNKIKSFVVTPISIGDNSRGKDSVIFGTLSFGYPIEYTYSVLEISLLESISNLIGVSITNYRSHNERMAELFDDVHNSALITSADVAQASRHEILLIVDTINNIIGTMRIKAKKGPLNSEVVYDTAKSLDLELERITDSLIKIKEVTSIPESIYSEESLKEVWEEAFNMVRGRLVHEKISTVVDIPETLKISVVKDSLLHAFFLIIKNSIDAYQSTQAKKSNRKIQVRLEKMYPNDRLLKLLYHDNATGINPAQLKIKDEDKKIPLSQIIFKPGVSSKKDGSGYGLYLVRKILNEHKGSINLTNYRNGVSFELSILINN